MLNSKWYPVFDWYRYGRKTDTLADTIDDLKLCPFVEVLVRIVLMDKSWIHIKNRLDPAYVQGVESFIECAYANKLLEAKICCPCKKCVNLKFETRTGVKEHIIINGFDTKYTRWTYHEELSASSSGSAMDVNHESDFMDDMVGLVHDAFGIPRQEGDLSDAEMINGVELGPDEKTKKFFKLLVDAKRELYPGCKTLTTLSFIMRLMHIKVLNGIIDKAFDRLLECLKLAFPPGETLPPSYNEAKKFRESLGFSYIKYDACPNDCMLFLKDKKDLDKCEICQTSWYKESKLRSDDGSAQNGSGQSCNEEHVLDANNPQQQNGDDRSRPLKAWTDEELMYEM
ncbi:hypothetical protein RHMOL_Rhmol02G0197000 [Rhododendron molle]|uniref:Uncharacterized protein n=1 Tax=Rhododendron molle TaxID=49168 RepID=A0ACC0PTE7_RHOML|nr:hypothetical protein RHMOL_Rhmol02G0197000 [Rhododendron molle]